MRKEWTLEEEIQLKEYVETGKYSFLQIGKLMNRGKNSCMCKSHKLGIINTYKPKFVSFNYDFWAIPNLINSYWAGFSSADCCVRKFTDNYYEYTLDLATKDLNHLEKFAKECEYSGKIVTRVRNQTNKKGEPISYSRFRVLSSKWGKDLENNFNIIPQKTYRLSPPNLFDKHLLLSWIAGYIDGDGSILVKKSSTNTNTISITMASCSEQMLIWIKSFIDKNFHIKLNSINDHSEIYNRKGNTFIYGFHGLRAAIFIDIIHQLKLPLLDRKWYYKELLDYINQKKLQHPDLFLTLDQSEIAPYIPNSQ